MNAAVVEFDALSDTVGAAAENHNLGFVVGDGILILRVVGGVVVGAVGSAAYMDAFPGFLHTQRNTAVPDIVFRDFKDLA